MPKTARFLFFLIGLSGLLCAQTFPDSIIKFKNGKTQKHIHHIDNETQVVQNFYENGQLKDSTAFKIETFIAVKSDPNKNKGYADTIYDIKNIEYGIGKVFYSNGKLKELNYYGNDTVASKEYSYRKNGKLKLFEQKPFGERILYNKKGKVIRYNNANKGKHVSVPKIYSDKKYLSNYSGRIKAKSSFLVKNKSKVKLNAGALISIRTTNDTAKYNNCLVEGFSGDSIVISKFSYDHDPETKNRLKYDSTFVLSFSSLSSINYASKNTKKSYTTASVLEILGMDLVIVPTVVLPLSGGAQTFPYVGGSIVVGTGLFIYSRWLYKKIVPLEYKFPDWTFKN
jgi:hypothetical protein